MNDFDSKKLLAIIENGEWNEKIKASDILAQNASIKITNSLILMLKSHDPEVRNASALALKEIGDNIAVKPLIEAIKLPENHRNISTMVYALESLDCSNFFNDIVDLAMSEKPFVHLSAMNILHKQSFFVDEDDILDAFEKLNIVKESKIDYNSLQSFLLDLQNDLFN